MDEESGDPYLFEDVPVLRNKLGIRDAGKLDRKERLLVTVRILQGAPAGAFDLAHLKAIHRHLFQDIYDWAGEVRTVEISKDGHTFQFTRSIEVGMGDVHRRLAAADFLKGLTAEAFAAAAGTILGDVNYVHPFREGNGRTQLQYLKQLAEQAGHAIDLSALNGEAGAWIAASRAAHQTDYGPMSALIARALAAGQDTHRR